jgi:type IV pilus assembly protein PilQ
MKHRLPIVIVSLIAAASLAQPPRVSRVEFDTDADGDEIVTITGDASLVYDVFSLEDPPRVIVDIKNAVHECDPLVKVETGHNVQRIRSSQYREIPSKIVRVVIDLNRFEPYFLTKAGETIEVRFPAPPGGRTTDGVRAEIAAVNNIEVQELIGKTRIEITADAPLRFDFSKTVSPHAFVLDLIGARADLDRPTLYLDQSVIVKVSATQYSESPQRVVRVVTQTTGDYPYLITRRGNALYLDVITEQTDPFAGLSYGYTSSVDLENVETYVTAEVAESGVGSTTYHTAETYVEESGYGGYSGEGGTLSAIPSGRRISMDLKDADIGNVLRMLAFETGMNIVAGPNVTGKVTVALRDVPWDEALRVILAAHGLSYRVEGSIIRVNTPEELVKMAEAEAASPIGTEIITLRYATAASLKASFESMISDRGQIQVEPRTNSLIVTDTLERRDRIRRLVEQLDARTAQVMIEAKIFDVRITTLTELGIDWEFGLRGNSIIIDTPANAGTLTATGRTAIDAATLQATLQANAADTDTNILSAPRITTLDNQEARILVGSRIPVNLLDEEGNTYVELYDVGIKLSVTPHVNSVNEITLDVRPEISEMSRTPAPGLEFQVDTTEASTTLLLQNGETGVIGGLLRRKSETIEQGVPLLSSIPVLGLLFKSTSDSEELRELLIFVTPHLVRPE